MPDLENPCGHAQIEMVSATSLASQQRWHSLCFPVGVGQYVSIIVGGTEGGGDQT